jgi:MSHA biogenesis protein MshG
VNLVHAGEEAGLLNEMLGRIASLLEYETETQQRIRAATFYPCLVLLELFVAGIVLLKFVLPRFAALFRNFQTELPLPTRILVAVSDVVEKQWLVLLLLLGGTVAGTVAWARSTRGRDVLDRWIITVPIFGPIFQKTIMSRFARAMAALIGAGIPIVRALELAREVTGNRAVGREVDRMREGILAGAGLADPVRDSPLFPPLVVKMMAVGEETGSIDKMLLKVSGYYDRDVDYAVKHLSTAIEPVLLAVLGTAVLFTALAVFLPLWNLIHVFQH